MKRKQLQLIGFRNKKGELVKAGTDGKPPSKTHRIPTYSRLRAKRDHARGTVKT